jgi:hypothetical protein
MKEFKNLIQTSNLISTDWEAYGRDLKITNLLIKLKQKKSHKLLLEIIKCI